MFLTGSCLLSFCQEISRLSDSDMQEHYTPDSLITETIYIRRVDTVFTIAHYLYAPSNRYEHLDTIYYDSRGWWYTKEKDGVCAVFQFKNTRRYDHHNSGYVCKPRKITLFMNGKKVSSRIFIGKKTCFSKQYVQ